MRKRIAYVVTGVLCFLLGVFLVSGIVYFFPNEIVRTVSEKKVEVTDTGIAESVEKIKDAVVVVETYRNNELISTGTGFVYDTDDEFAYIMTNHHVIDNQDRIKITYSDDTEAYAGVVGSDEYADIAVLKVEKSSIKSVASLGKSEDLRIGDTVFTIGSPMGIDFRGTVTKGIISGKDRLVSVSISGNSADWIMNVMQTDAAINPGNSGGPLCNINGEVIGINSLKIVKDTIEGIGFAIPIEDAINYAESIREKGSISRPYVGVSMLNASSTMQLAYEGIRLDRNITEGVVIVQIENGSPASEAGIERGDVIIKVGEHKVRDIAEFRYRLYSYNPDETIEIVVNRNGEEKTLKVKLVSN